MTITLNKNDGWVLLFVYLLFQPTLGSMVGGPLGMLFSYSDELIVVILTGFALLRCTGKRISRYERSAVICFVIFELFGLSSTLFFQNQSVLPALVDALTCVKFFLIFMDVRILSYNKITDASLMRFNTIARILAVIMFALAVHDLLFTPFFPKFDFRYFTDSIRLFFGHPESLSRFSFYLILILFYNMKSKPSNFVDILLLSFVMFFTLRIKAIIALFVFFMMYFYFISMKLKGKLPIALTIIVGGVILGKNTFDSYYSHADYARTLLTVDAAKYATHYFPLGTGFGSFASSMAAQFYSKLYVACGYLDMWGMGPDSEFLSDTFWPIVIAQTGWIGAQFFLAGLVRLIQLVLSMFRRDRYLFIASTCVIIYDLISSIGAPAFFHPSALGGYLLLGLFVSKYARETMYE